MNGWHGVIDMTIYAEFDAEGLAVAFYDMDFHNYEVPGSAREITRSQWQELVENPFSRRWQNGDVVEYTPPPPIPTADDFRREIQNLIDTKAQEKDYDSGATLASYVNSTIQQWATEAQAFVAWRDAVWLHALTELDKVQSGQREQPSVEDFLTELPTLEWPEL